MKSKGFTLIELLVVIVILGILMGLIIPNITGGIRQANLLKCQRKLGNFQTAVMQYYSYTGTTRYPGGRIGEPAYTIWKYLCGWGTAEANFLNADLRNPAGTLKTDPDGTSPRADSEPLRCPLQGLIPVDTDWTTIDYTCPRSTWAAMQSHPEIRYLVSDRWDDLKGGGNHGPNEGHALNRSGKVDKLTLGTTPSWIQDSPPEGHTAYGVPRLDTVLPGDAIQQLQAVTR